MRFDEKVIVVTGGNSGIGLSAAKAFAAQGAQVVITGRNRARMEEISRQEESIHGLVADAMNVDSAKQVAEDTVARFGRIDVLVNNVGAAALGGVDQLDLAKLRDVLDVNVVYTMAMIQACLPHLESTKGNIVNVTSTFGHIPSPFASTYGLSKAAVEHLTQSLSLELAPKGVRVNAIAPGPTESNFLKEGMKLSDAEINHVKETEIARIPMGRRGEPDEVSHWIVEVASAEAGWITGQSFHVDGGMSIT